MSDTTAAPAQTGGKGLSTKSVGLVAAVFIGVSCIAPAYTLSGALGPTASEVGEHLPAILLVGFIPMLLVALGYRELNRAMPDSGTSFTWATATPSSCSSRRAWASTLYSWPISAMNRVGNCSGPRLSLGSACKASMKYLRQWAQQARCTS